MYHIIYNLENRHDSLEEVQTMLKNLVLKPRIPETAMQLEDQDTPRICVAPTIEDCITAIGVTGTFRRCANTNEDAKSYENDDEVYPIIVIELPDTLNYITPDKNQVPDIEATNEKWLVEPFTPTSKEIKWLDQYSIDFNDDHPVRTVCTGIRFVTDLEGKHHPWLDKKGHPLDCSDYGHETWPDNITKNIFHIAAKQFLCWDGGPKQAYVYPVPISNNYAICHITNQTDSGLVLTSETYRAPIHHLRRFSGYHDQNGLMIFDNDLVWYGNDTPRLSGQMKFWNNTWYISIWSKPEPILVTDIAGKTDTLDCITLMDTLNR